MKLIDVSVFSKFFSYITGIKLSAKDMMAAGHRIHTLERYMNTREGITRKDDTLPARFLTEHRIGDVNKITVTLDKMVKKYYKLRGYDNNGIPSKKTMKKLNIEIKA
jgi:aldehyde:ferredoxin oxidoreductase